MQSNQFFISPDQLDLSTQDKQLLARVYRFILARAREKEAVNHDPNENGREWVNTPGQDAGTNAVSAGKFTA